MSATDLCTLSTFEGFAASGPGYICVNGKPSSGKTSAVLSFLGKRKARWQRRRSRAGGMLLPVVHFIHLSPLALGGGWLAAAHQALLLEVAGAKRTSERPSLYTLGSALRYAMDAMPCGSELHLVVDDADMLAAEELAGVETWASAAAGGKGGRSLFVWIISQVELSIRPCVRVHQMVKSPVWQCRGAGATFAASLQHFASKRPMAGSVVARDTRLLAQAVGQVDAPTERMNNLQYSELWRRIVHRPAAVCCAGSAATPHADSAVSSLGPSAQLLFVACFFCGAVAAAKDRQILGDGSGRTQRPRRAQQGQTVVLSSSAQVVYSSRLENVYAALSKVSLSEHEQRLLLSKTEVMHHLKSFLAWSYMTLLVNASNAYHCHIPVAEALSCASEIGISLMDLIPT